MEGYHTQGPWIYNDKTSAIESTKEWFVEPNKEEDEEGIPTQVISTLAAMGGEYPKADIALICAAPDMIELLFHILREYDVSTGGINSDLPNEFICKVREVVDKATRLTDEG